MAALQHMGKPNRQPLGLRHTLKNLTIRQKGVHKAGCQQMPWFFEEVENYSFDEEGMGLEVTGRNTQDRRVEERRRREKVKSQAHSCLGKNHRKRRHYEKHSEKKP